MKQQLSNRWTWIAAMVAAIALAGPWACTTGPDLEEMEYADQAEYLFQQGQAALERGRYIEAIDQFNTVRNEYPYSRWASMANLGIADAYFDQEQFASAVQQYRGFVQLYPSHEHVEYARWRVALAFYEQMPSDFFIFPPPYERDLTTTRDAVRELQIFLREYDDSQYADRAQNKWREAMTRLANHEYYVAEHYMGEDNPVAAIDRLQYLLDHFTGLGLDAEALYMLGEAYLQIGQRETAQRVFRDLVEYHPNHPRAADANTYLAEF